jgi:hypothetical protein
MDSLGLKRTQTTRKVQRFQAEGSKRLQSRKTGLRNNSLDDKFRLQVMELVKEHYADFCPTFAAEKPLDRHRVEVFEMVY